MTTIAAADESDFNMWLDAISDTLELREMAIQNEDPRETTPKKIMSPQVRATPSIPCLVVLWFHLITYPTLFVAIPHQPFYQYM